MLAGAAVAWFRTNHLAEAAALFGFEPSALIDPVWRLPEFAADFPNGEAETLKSLVGQVYRLLGYLPLSKQAIVTGMIFAEFCTLAAGAFVCARAVDPKLQTWIGLGTALLLTTGTIISCDLARWFHPYYGSAYNFAYGAGLAGFAAIIANRPVLAGLAVGVAGAIHPIIALFFGLAMAGAALVRIASYSLLRLAAGGALAALVAGSWAYLILGDSGVSSAEADPGLYIALTRMISSHWFPFSLGVFGVRSWETLLPFTGFILLFISLLGGGGEVRDRADRQIGAAVLGLVVLAFIGALISEYSGHPLLTKLALHRASAVALVLAAVVVIPRMLAIAVQGPPLQSVLAILLVMTPFWSGHGLPIEICVLFVLIRLVEQHRSGSQTTRMVALAVAIVPALAAIHTAGASLLFFGWWAFGTGLFATVALAIAASARILREPALLALALAGGVWVWVPSLETMRGEQLAQARAYLEVQEWARYNTAPDALFMTDPGHAYGWREHSRRPSFGTLREWLYSGWIYNTRREVMQEGLARTKALGLDLNAYLEQEAREPGSGFGAMRAEASRLYHEKDGHWFATMAKEYNVDYFVLDKTQADEIPRLPVVFENQHYAILTP